MSDVHVTCGVNEDAAGVVVEGSWCGNTACNWTSLIDFLDHCIFSSDSVKLIDLVHVISVRDEAVVVGVAVAAGCDGRALDAVVVASGSVN